MLDEINCRLDLRGFTKTKLILLFEYVQEIGAMFLVGDKNYAPKLENLLESMKNSKTNQYCNNPMKNILSLNKTLED